MNKKLVILFSLACFTCTPSIQVQAQPAVIEAYENRSVASIEIKAENLPSNASFDSKTIANRLKTKIGDPFSQSTFDSDLKTLASEYDQIEPYIEIRNGDVFILIKVWQKPLIRSIEFEGNEYLKTKALKKELNVSSHTSLNRIAFNKGLNKIRELYIKKGYFEAQVTYRLKTDPKTNEVDVIIDINEGRSGYIDNIIFKGLSKEDESGVLKMIQTKKYNIFLSWILGTGTYNEDALEQDRMAVVNYLQNQGYADAAVDIQITDSKNAGKIIIEITAKKGQIYKFGRVTFEGNTLINNETIESAFLARPGSTYSPEKIRNSVQSIKDLYGRKGYIEASVNYETQLVENEPLYNVYFQIDEGAEYKIGLIHIIGNIQTQDKVILRESLLIPGETFDSAKLEATQSRLEHTGYFKVVNVYAVRTPDDDALGENYRDVYIEVSETTTGNISAFFGASSADSLFTGLDLAETNFNIKGFGCLFTQGLGSLRGGGEYAHIKVTLGKKQTNFSIAWLDPYFNDTLWRVGIDISKSTSTLISNDYRIDSLGGTLYGSYPLTPFLSFGLKYRCRYIDIKVRGKAGDEAYDELKTNGILSGAGLSLTYDSTDHPLKPHRGYRSLLDGEITGVGGDFYFYKFGFINTLYTPLWRCGTMKYRADARFIKPFGMTSKPEEIPLSDRFFLGGEGSVRGYEAYELGPEFGNHDPKGGISSSLLSVEYNHQVFSFLDLFTFVDAGMVSMKEFHFRKYNMSWGFGARVDLLSKIPFTIGLGFPINEDRESQVRKFFFSMGGQF
jgi:outer membrane protein insertion porin family